jgi:putative membrane protein
VLAALVGIAIWYLRAEWRLALRGRAWSPWRRASFLSGLICVDLAFQSPVSTFANFYFQAHIVQHLLLMVAAPVLCALGAPSTLLLQTSSRWTKEHWLAVLRSRPFAVLTNPVVVWFLYYGIMLVFFLSSLLNVAMEHMALMDAMNVLFLFGGTLFWWPMIGIDPIIHGRMSHGVRLANILVGSGMEVFLGLALVQAKTPVASMYTVSSTRSGGALLWGSTEFVALIALVPIFVQWMRSDEREARRLDARLDRQAAGVTVGEPRDGEGSAPPGATDRTLTAWEAEWLARTGSVPTQDPVA